MLALQIEDEMQQLFLSHANVFDEDMQNFFIQNFIHEAECAKTFRTAVRRTSLVRRCLLAMYPAEKNKTATETSRWSPSLVSRVVQHRRSNSLEVCPEVDNPVIIEVVKNEIANISSWDFNVFVVRSCTWQNHFCANVSSGSRMCEIKPMRTCVCPN